MATINVRNADGQKEPIEKPLPPGRAAASDSRPVALSTDDKAALDALAVGKTATDRSATIATGGAAQQVMAANAGRRTWTFINNSDTVMNLHIAGTASATAGMPLNPGDIAEGQETNALSVYCAASGKAFTAWES